MEKPTATSKAEEARVAKIFELAGILAAAVCYDRAVFLTTYDAREILDWVDVPSVLVNTATAADFAAMEDVLRDGGGYVLYASYSRPFAARESALVLLDRLKPEVRAKFAWVDLTGGARTVYATASVDDAEPLRQEAKRYGATQTYFWNVNPKIVAASVEASKAHLLRASGWRMTPYPRG